MLPVTVKIAKLADFRAPTSRILFGERLKQVIQIQNSIAAHGLLNPLIVMRRGAKLIVVDGKKRLAALRRMRFAGELPRSLVDVPYILVSETEFERPSHIPAMSLLSNQERYTEVVKLRKKGFGLMEIAAKLYISKDCVKDLLRVSLLSPRLKRAFFGGTISTAQARAFATLPNMEAQDQLLIALGPFANVPEILKAIESGETVINMDEENIIILPSRHIPASYAGPEDLAA
jgi:ParB-like chromosome segregation protein Spo0J